MLLAGNLCQEPEGDARRQAGIPGEVRKGDQQLRLYQMTSSSHLCASFCPNCHREAPLGWPEGHVSVRGACVYSERHADWHWPERSRLSTGALFSPQMRAGSR